MDPASSDDDAASAGRYATRKRRRSSEREPAAAVGDEVKADEHVVCDAGGYATVWATCWYSDDGNSLRHVPDASEHTVRPRRGGERPEGDDSGSDEDASPLSSDRMSGAFFRARRGWAVMRQMERPRGVTDDDEDGAARETGQADSPLSTRNESAVPGPFFYVVESTNNRVITEGGCASPLVASLLRVVRIHRTAAEACHAPPDTPVFYVLGVEARVPLAPPADHLTAGDLTSALRHTGYAMALAASYSGGDGSGNACARSETGVRWMRHRLRDEGMPGKAGPWVDDDELRALGAPNAEEADGSGGGGGDKTKKQSPVVAALRKAIATPLRETAMEQRGGTPAERRKLVVGMAIGGDAASSGGDSIQTQREDRARETVRRRCNALPGLPPGRLVLAYGGVSCRPDLEARILWHGVALADVCHFVEEYQTRQSANGATVNAATRALGYLHDSLMRRNKKRMPSLVARDILLPPPAFGRSFALRRNGGGAADGYRTFLASAHYHTMMRMGAPVYVPWSKGRQYALLRNPDGAVHWRTGVSQRAINEDAIAAAKEGGDDTGNKRARPDADEDGGGVEGIAQRTMDMLAALANHTHVADPAKGHLVDRDYKAKMRRIGGAFARVANRWRSATGRSDSGASMLGPLTVRAYYCYRGDAVGTQRDATVVVSDYVNRTWGRSFDAKAAPLTFSGDATRAEPSTGWNAAHDAFEVNDCVVVGDMARCNVDDVATMADAIEHLSERGTLRCRHVVFVVQVNSMASRIGEAVVAEAAEINVDACNRVLGAEDAPVSYDDLDGVVDMRSGLGPLGRGDRSDTAFPARHRAEQLDHNKDRVVYGRPSQEDLDAFDADTRWDAASVLSRSTRDVLKEAINHTVVLMKRTGRIAPSSINVYVLYKRNRSVSRVIHELRSAPDGVCASTVRTFRLTYAHMAKSADTNDAAFFSTLHGALCGATGHSKRHHGVDVAPHVVVLCDTKHANYRHVNSAFMGPAHRIVALDASKEEFARVYHNSNFGTDMATLSTRQTDDITQAFDETFEGATMDTAV